MRALLELTSERQLLFAGQAGPSKSAERSEKKKFLGRIDPDDQEPKRKFPNKDLTIGQPIQQEKASPKGDGKPPSRFSKQHAANKKKRFI